MPEHIGWPRVPRLAVALLDAVAVHATGRNPHLLLADSDVQSWRNQLKLAAQAWAELAATRATAAVPPLATYFADVANNMHKAQSATSQHAVVLDAELRKRLAAAPCETCSPGQPCAGVTASTLADEARLDARGGCIQPLRDIFVFACNLAAAAVAMHASDVRPPALHLSTSDLGPARTSLGLAVTAGTTEAPPGLSGRVVKVSVAPELFDIADYWATLAVVYHDCFVHGWCGVRLDAAGSFLSTDFHEGWVDSVGADLFASAVAVTAPVGAVSEALGEMCRQASALQAQRLSAMSPDARAWRVALVAGETMRWLFGLVLESPVQAQQALWRYTVQLNVSDATHRERGAFVTQLNVIFGASDPAERAMALANHPEVIDFVEKWTTNPSPTSAAELARDIGGMVL